MPSISKEEWAKIFSRPPIVSTARINYYKNRIPRQDSPGLEAFLLSRYVLAEILGEDWVREYVVRSDTPTFLLNNNETPFETAMHVVRVIQLAEMLLNCQWIRGYGNCVSQLKTPEMIESTYAELDIARALITHNRKFIFNDRTGKRGADFDLLITLPDGTEACADTKCKLESTAFSEQTILNSLEDARSRNLPKTRPGIIFAKIPREWVETDEQHQKIVEITERFFKTTERIVSVKYYVSFISEDEHLFRETMGWYEIANPRNRFDKAVDWRLFASHSEVAAFSWNGMPPHWKRILRGDFL